jgi:probable rRNA maturation factor
MILIDNEDKIPLNIELLEAITRDLNITRDIELLIVDNPTIKDLNREHRGKDRATDVLSFPIDDFGLAEVPLGSIVISKDKAIEASKRFNHSIEDEISLLFIHALLHLLGYDHEQDSGEMRELEESLIKKFNLPDSLIVRNS